MGAGLFALGLRQCRSGCRCRSVTEQGTGAARGALEEAGLRQALQGLGHVPVHDLQMEGRERIPLSETRDLPMQGLELGAPAFRIALDHDQDHGAFAFERVLFLAADEGCA
jgi:hypothetical protein